MESKGPKRGWWSGWGARSAEAPISEQLLGSRITRLEREVRIYRALFALVAAMIVGLGSLHLIKPGVPTSDVIRAHRVEVVDKKGRMGVELETDEVGGRIALRYGSMPGSPPPPAMFLGADPTGGALQLFEPGQNFYALSLDVGQQGQGVIKVRRRGMQPGLELNGPSSDTTGGELLVFGGNGKPAVRLASDDAGRGIVSTQKSP